MRKSNRKRSLVGAFLMLLILISGTFAFYQFNQGAFNPVRLVQRTVGRLHDDFERNEIGGQVVQRAGHMNKDVFAENFTTEDLMIRVQFREFLQLNSLTATPNTFGGDGVLINDHSTWPVVLFDGFNVVDGAVIPTRTPDTVSEEIGDFGIYWYLGGEKIFMPTHNRVHTNAANYDDRFVTNNWLVDGSGDLVTPFELDDLLSLFRFSNTTGLGGEALARIANNPGGLDAAATNVEHFIQNGLQTGASISDGTHAFWTTVPDTVDSNGNRRDIYCSFLFIVENDEITLQLDGDEEPEVVCLEAQPTLEPANSPAQGIHNGIMTVTQWNLAGNPVGNFWIMDYDGWFYWNGELAGSVTREGDCDEFGPGADVIACLPTIATSLLLDQIYVPNHSDLSYVIHVNGQWMARGELAGFYPAASNEILSGFNNFAPFQPEGLPGWNPGPIVPGHAVTTEAELLAALADVDIEVINVQGVIEVAGTIVVDREVTIQGPGTIQATSTLNAFIGSNPAVTNPVGRPFVLHITAPATVSNLTVTGPSNPNGDFFNISGILVSDVPAPDVVTLQGITIDHMNNGTPGGGAQAYRGGRGIEVLHSNVEILNSTIQGTADNAIDQLGGHLLVENSTLISWTADENIRAKNGVVVRPGSLTTTLTGNTFSNFRFTGAPTPSGISVMILGGTTTMTGNVINNSDRAVHVDGATTILNTQNTTFIGNDENYVAADGGTINNN